MPFVLIKAAESSEQSLQFQKSAWLLRLDALAVLWEDHFADVGVHAEESFTKQLCCTGGQEGMAFRIFEALHTSHPHMQALYMGELCFRPLFQIAWHWSFHSLYAHFMPDCGLSHSLLTARSTLQLQRTTCPVSLQNTLYGI